jgi:integrase
VAHPRAQDEGAPEAHRAAVATGAEHFDGDISPHGSWAYVFPSVRSELRPLSNVALLAALRRMGYEQGTVTVHGFRSTASTLLNEMGKNRDWIERQLAHGERDGVRASYNYADYLPQRKLMMQEWADYLDRLRKWPLGGERAIHQIPLELV